MEMENSSLKEQFERLQAQQTEKLMRRKQKKDAEAAEKKPGSAASGAFGITDELDLKV